MGECKGCTSCWSRLYGCTNSRCYCHTHPLEPVPVTLLHDAKDPACFWHTPNFRHNAKPTKGNCPICREAQPNQME